MLGFGSCLGRQTKKDVLEDRSSSFSKHGQEIDRVENKPPDLPDADQPLSPPISSVSHQPQNPDNVIPRTNMIELIVKKLENEGVGKVVLHGKHGVGKTWIAKEVTKQAFLKKSFDLIIWVYNRQIQYSSVFHQISIQENFVGVDYYLGDDGAQQGLIIQLLQQKLTEKKVLLVFDNDDDPQVAHNDPLRQLENVLSNADKSSKVLITTPTINDVMMTCYHTDSHSEPVEIKPLTVIESKDLLIKSWKKDQIRLLDEDDLQDIVKRCKCLPAAIVFTGNMLLYAIENASHDYYTAMAIREAKKDLDEFWMLSSGFEKFRNNVTILKCLWLSVNYLQGHKSINYNKLILFWMLDGCFDYTTSLDNAYAHGHKVVIDFLDAGLLGGREVGDIVLQRAGFKFAQYVFQITPERFRLEKFCKFYDLSISGNVKRINSSIGLFTKSGVGKSDNVDLVTLLLKGNDMSKADQFKFEDIHLTKNIRILFASLVEPILSLQQMCPFICVLILKDCDSVSEDNISDIGNLTHLMVLEISGCKSLRKLPEDFLANFELLESLNLSANPIKSFPRLRFGLSNLRSLSMKRCLELESFPDVNGLRELRILDLSGSKFNSSKSEVWYLEELPELGALDLSETDIYECPDLTKLDKLKFLFLKNCPLLNKLELQTWSTELEVVEASGCSELDYLGELNVNILISKIDFSKSKLSKLPPLRDASNLIHLGLSGCIQLKELPPIEGAINLRNLDVSDAIQLEEINTSFEEMRSLQELNLSNTAI